MSAPIRLRDPNVSSKTYTFNFSFGGLAALLTAFTLALTLFFVLGVLVGRGHRPETVLAPVARIMPTEAPAKQVSEVLKPEELGYNEQLAGKKGEGPAPAKPLEKTERKAPDKAAEKKDDKSADKLAAKLADKKAADKSGKPADKTDKKAKKDEKPDPDTQRYDYAYQCASFPDMEQAKAFLKKIKSQGFKADIESGDTGGKAWHRVVVFFQGTPTDTRDLKEKLAKLGATKPLMRSKTPAS
jgi:cell division protein FtsN